MRVAGWINRGQLDFVSMLFISTSLWTKMTKMIDVLVPYKARGKLLVKCGLGCLLKLLFIEFIRTE